MSNVTLNTGSGGAVMATEQNASAPNENYQIVEIASGAGAAFANRLTITAAGAAKIDASGTVIQANAGTNLNTSALALESGGNLAALLGRLPATAVLADATANPTLTAVQDFLMGFNGTTWDRLKATSGSLNVHLDAQTVAVSAASLPLPTGAATAAKQPALGTAGSASADVLTVQGIASMTALKVDGSAVTQPVSGTVTTTPPSNASTNITQWAGTAVDTNSGVKSAGTLRVVLATDQPQLTNKLLVTADPITFASAQAVTQSGTWTVQPGNTANTTPWLTSNVPPSNGTQGWSFNYQSALSSTKQQIKGSAGTFGGYLNLMNPNTADTYIQVFNKASASVTVGTTTPDFVIRMPGLASASGTGVAANLELVNGLAMSTGITVAATTTATGSTAPANALTATFLFL